MNYREKQFVEKIQNIAIGASALRERCDMLEKENEFLKKQNLELIKNIQPKRIITE